MNKKITVTSLFAISALASPALVFAEPVIGNNVKLTGALLFLDDSPYDSLYFEVEANIFVNDSIYGMFNANRQALQLITSIAEIGLNADTYEFGAGVEFAPPPDSDISGSAFVEAAFLSSTINQTTKFISLPTVETSNDGTGYRFSAGYRLNQDNGKVNSYGEYGLSYTSLKYDGLEADGGWKLHLVTDISFLKYGLIGFAGSVDLDFERYYLGASLGVRW